jgi:hypothetical protein
MEGREDFDRRVIWSDWRLGSRLVGAWELGGGSNVQRVPGLHRGLVCLINSGMYEVSSRRTANI